MDKQQFNFDSHQFFTFVFLLVPAVKSSETYTASLLTRFGPGLKKQCSWPMLGQKQIVSFDATLALQSVGIVCPLVSREKSVRRAVFYAENADIPIFLI